MPLYSHSCGGLLKHLKEISVMDYMTPKHSNNHSLWIVLMPVVILGS